jgi:hypothetical protein
VTKEQNEALDTCLRAIARERGDDPETGKRDQLAKDVATKIIICLDALGLLKSTAAA